MSRLTVQQGVDALGEQDWKFLRLVYWRRLQSYPCTAEGVAQTLGLSSFRAAIARYRILGRQVLQVHRAKNPITRTHQIIDGRRHTIYTYTGTKTWTDAIEARIAREP